MNLNRIIEFCLAHRPAIAYYIEERRKDPGNGKVGGTAGMAFRSDPTSQCALRNLNEVGCVEIPYGIFTNGKQDIFTLRYPERWLKVIDYTEAFYQGKLQAKLIQAKYRECKSREQICEELNIGKSLYFVVQNDIFCFAAGVAIGLGAVPPRH